MERLSDSTFKLKSGNKPSPIELSGVSPVKHVDSTTGEQMTVKGVAQSEDPYADLKRKNRESSDRLRSMAAGDFSSLRGVGTTIPTID